MKIGEDEIDEGNILELPIVLRENLTRSDIERINEVIDSLSNYVLKVPFTFVCPRCGEKREEEGTSFHVEYIFPER